MGELNRQLSQQGIEGSGCPLPEFLAWLRAECSYRSMRSVGLSLGVTGAGVKRWLDGSSGVSATVLLLAERLMREPRELPAGLPSSDGRREAG